MCNFLLILNMLYLSFPLIKLLIIFGIINTYSSEKNIDTYNKNLEYETTASSNKVVKKISRFFDKFYSLDISTRVFRVSSIYPFHCELDGSTTIRISFFQIFKQSKVFKHNFVFELNFLKAKDLGGRGFDFLERKLGNNIILDNWNENNNSKKITNGSYFFSLLNKTAIFFSIGFEGNGIYNKLFNSKITKSGFGIRIPLWCDGLFGLVKNLNLDSTKNFKITKESGCNKWKKLCSKKPGWGFFGNITLYFKPFIYEFDNGFRIDLTWETCVNDYRYTFYKIKKSKNENNIAIYNIANKSKSVNCFRSFLIFIENLFILRTKLEVGFNIAKLI